MILSDIRQGLGVCIAEPHGGLTAQILAGIPRHRLNDLVYLDVEDWEYPFGLNLFEVPYPGNVSTKAAAASFVSYLLETIYNSLFKNKRLMQNLRAASRTLIANPGSSFGDIPLLYASEEVRARMLANVDNPQILTFWEEYERMNFRDRRLFTESTLNKVTAFLDEPMIAHILFQSKTTINFRYIMDNSKILLIKLSPQFEEASRLIGAVIIGKILMTAFSRADIPDENKRVQFNLYCDEFYRFASSDFATLISEARKFRIRTTISYQTLTQLSEQNRASALAAGNLIVFRVSGDPDARVLSKSFDTTPARIVNGEEVVRAPVADVILHLVIRGHNDPRVARFGTTYLANLEHFINKPPVPHEPQYSAYHHNFDAIHLHERHVVWGREYLNECLYKAMIEKRSDFRLPTLAIYILAVAQGDGREYILSNWVEKSFGEFHGFKPGAEKFGKPSFVTPLKSQDYISQITKVRKMRDVWMAEAIVNMLRETRYCMEVLSREPPLMVDTGRMQPRYQMQTHADREAEISKELTIQENFKARVKIVNGGEYMITTKPAPESLTGDALAERIETVKRHCRALGYTRHYTEVEEELRKRQEFLFGLGDTLNDTADDDGYDLSEPRQDPDEAPRGSFTLD